MNYSFFMGSRKALRDLQGVVHTLAHREGAFTQVSAKAFAFEEFGDDVRSAILFTDEMDRHDVGVIEGGGSLCFLAEAAQAIGVLDATGTQNFQSNVTSKRGVASSIDFAHSARAKNGKYLVGPKLCAGSQHHCWAAL